MLFFIDLLNYTVCWKPVLYCCGENSSVHFTLLEFFRPASFDYRRFNSDLTQYYVPNILLGHIKDVLREFMKNLHTKINYFF